MTALIIALIVLLLYCRIAIQKKTMENYTHRDYMYPPYFIYIKYFATPTLAQILPSDVFEEILKRMTLKLYCSLMMDQNNCF